ncbi:MAG: hypothetical protein IKZ54_00740 [Bacteroidales bacterium]|nr:hypothetical protein [Bacteroidales bacterium]
MPADLRPASSDCVRRHWEARPASSRTRQECMAWWNGAGTRKMRTPLGVRGEVWKGLI